MIRRQFLKLATLTGATGLASLGSLEALGELQTPSTPDTKDTEFVTWRVRGFACLTCAVGLETLLRQQNGVVAASASYPGALVTAKYHPGAVSQTELQSLITGLGFTAEKLSLRPGRRKTNVTAAARAAH